MMTWSHVTTQTWTLGLGPSVMMTTGYRYTPFESGSVPTLGAILTRLETRGIPTAVRRPSLAG
jgi:hypothetical protein